MMEVSRNVEDLFDFCQGTPEAADPDVELAALGTASRNYVVLVTRKVVMRLKD